MPNGKSKKSKNTTTRHMPIITFKDVHPKILFQKYGFTKITEKNIKREKKKGRKR